MRKILILLTLLTCLFGLTSCQKDYNDKLKTSFINETLDFDLTVETGIPTAGNASSRGEEIEHLVPMYATAYENDEYLQNEIKLFRQWQWFDLYTSLDEKTKEYPDHLNTYRLQAEAYLTNSKYVYALAALDNIIERDHDDIHALALTSIIKHFLGDRTQELARLKALKNVSEDCYNDVVNFLGNMDKWIKEEHGNGLEIEQSYDCIIVLGVSPSPSGSLTASGVLRIKEAVKAYYSNPNAKIIVSGGAIDTDYSEASVMAKYLKDHSNELAQALELTTDPNWVIPEEDILLEELARDTVGNIMGSFEFIKQYNLKDILLVGSTSQVMRAEAIAKAYALANNYEVTVKSVGSGEVAASNNEYRYSYVCAAKAYGLFTYSDFIKYIK